MPQMFDSFEDYSSDPAQEPAHVAPHGSRRAAYCEADQYMSDLPEVRCAAAVLRAVQCLPAAAGLRTKGSLEHFEWLS